MLNVKCKKVINVKCKIVKMLFCLARASREDVVKDHAVARGARLLGRREAGERLLRTGTKFDKVVLF
jgi:hypothetical protein